MKILVLKKLNNDINWSDSLNLLNYNLSSIKDVELHVVDISYNIINNYKKLKGLKRKICSSFDVIILHHAITFYFCFFFLLLFQSKAKVFFAHEGEIHLGWKYAFKNKQIKSFGSFLRFSKVWNKLPCFFFDHVYALSSRQSKQYSKVKVVHFLGVDDTVFNISGDSSFSKGIFFPANILRFEKGWHLLSDKNKKMCFYPYNTPNKEMPSLYNQAKVVVIPSVFETYCIALVEALLCNKVVVTTSNIGLAYDLLQAYGSSYLEKRGLFVFNSIKELNENLQDIYMHGVNANTRELALDNNLSCSSSAKKLYETLLEVV